MDVREFNPRVEASGEHPHACTGGFVFVGYIDEDGEEAIEALPCRRCAERSTMTKELAQELVGLFDLTGWHDMQESLYADLESRSAEEMEEEFGRVADLLRGLAYTAESSLG